MAFSFDALTQCFIKKDGYLWEVPVREISFDQKIQQEVIEHNRMPTSITGQVNVSAEGVENVFTAPAEWEITTHAKTFFSSGTGTGKVSHSAGVAHSVDEVLWDSFESGNGSFEALDQSITLDQSTWTPTNIDNHARCNLTNTKGAVTFSPIDQGSVAGTQNVGVRLNWVVQYGGVTIPRAYVSWHDSWTRLRKIADDNFSGLCYFIKDRMDWSNEFGSRYDPSIILFVPRNTDGSIQTVPQYIDANGDSNFTISATSITTTNFSNFNADSSRKDFLITLKDDNYIRSEGYTNPYTYDSTLSPVLRADTLGTFDMYFVTNTPAESGSAGTASANNRLIYREPYRESGGGAYNIEHTVNRTTGFLTSLTPAGRLHTSMQIALDTVHHSGHFPAGVTKGWNAGWEYESNKLLTDGGYTQANKLTTHGGFSNLEVNDIYPANTFVFPSKIIRNNVEYAVNASNKTWSDGSFTHNAPAMAFSVNGSGRLQKDSIILLDNTQINFSANGMSSSIAGTNKALGYQMGDQLVFAASTQATNSTGGVAAGTTLGAEVRFVVTNVGIEKFRSNGYQTQMILFDSQNAPNFGLTSTDIDTKDYFATFYDDSTGTTHNLTRNPNKIVYTRTTAEIASTASSRTHTLTAENTTIIVGSRVDHSSLDGPVFVTAVSGTSITFHTSVSLADGDVLNILAFPDYFGMSAGQFMLHEDDTGRIGAIVRHPLGTSTITDGTANIQTSDVLSIFESTAATKDGGRVYKLKNCVIDTANINMELDELVSVTWGGFASNLLNQADDFVIQSSAPSTPYAGQIHYDLDNDEVKIRNTANSAWIDCFTEGVDSASGYIQPKQSYLRIKQQKTLGTENLPTNPIFFNLNNFNNFTEQNTATPLVYDTVADGFSGLSSVSGFTRNVARKILGTYLSSSYENYIPHSVEYALTIDGTTYNTASGHFKGVCSANTNNTIISNLRSSTTFGDFVIIAETISATPEILDDYYLQLLFCTGNDTTYNTAAKLDAAKISLEIILPSQTTSIEFFPRLTSASIELSNNLEMIVPNVLGPTENATIGHVRGKRTCTFSAGMYSDETVSDLTTYLENNGKNELYNQASFTVPSEFQVFFSFGEPANYATNTLPMFQVLSERSVLNIPSTSAGDIFETTIEGICPSGTPAVFYMPA